MILGVNTILTQIINGIFFGFLLIGICCIFCLIFPGEIYEDDDNERNDF